jgi:hypothetical protein
LVGLIGGGGGGGGGDRHRARSVSCHWRLCEVDSEVCPFVEYPKCLFGLEFLYISEITITIFLSEVVNNRTKFAAVVLHVVSCENIVHITWQRLAFVVVKRHPNPLHVVESPKSETCVFLQPIPAFKDEHT